MKKFIVCILALFFSLNFLFAQQKRIINWEGKETEVAADYIVAQIKQGITVSKVEEELQILGLYIEEMPDKLGILKINISKSNKSFLEDVERLKNLRLFKFVEPDPVMYISINPNDQYFSNQYAPPKVSAPSAWDITTGNSNILIAILDTGIPMVNNILSHPDLQNSSRITLGTDQTNENDGTLRDENGHGTHVAGISGAETNNSIGIAGMGWNSKMKIYQVFNANGSGFPSWFKDAVVEAVDQGCKVINFSGGSNSPSSSFTTAIEYAANKALIVVAAGNYHPVNNPNREVEYPAAYSVSYNNVIAVSSTTNGDLLSSTSSYGPEITVAAPGDGIYSTFPDYSVPDRPLNYGYNSGTSMAAPLVSGLAGLIYSININFTPQQVRYIIEQSSYDLTPLGFDNYYGHGRVEANRALLLALAHSNNSINQTATSFNNGRRLLEKNGYFHLVFSSGGEIFYRKRTPWGVWESPIILSRQPKENNYPSISKSSSGHLFVTWQRKTGTNSFDIYVRYSTDDGLTWNNNNILTSITSSLDPLPVIQAESNFYQPRIIAFKNNPALTSYITHDEYPPYYSYEWSQKKIVNDPSYLHPSIAKSLDYNGVVFQHINGGIYYKYYYPYSWSWITLLTNLSLIVPGSGIHETPSLSAIPGSNIFHVAWKKLIGSGSSQYDHLIIHRKSTDHDTWPNQWYGTYYTSQDMPSISALASNKVDLLFQMPPQFGSSIYKMRFNGSSWNSPTFISSNAKYPSVSSGSTTAKYVWTGGTASPYTVNLSTETLSKESEENPLDYYSRSIAWLDSSGSYLEVKFHPAFIKMKDGTKQRIDFIPVSLDTFELTQDNSWDFLSTLSFQVPSNAEELIFDYSISGKDINKVLNGAVNNLSPVFSLSNNSGQIIVNQIQNHLLSSGQLQEIRRQLSVSLNGLSNQKSFRVLIKLNGLNPKEGTLRASDISLIIQAY